MDFRGRGRAKPGGPHRHYRGGPDRLPADPQSQGLRITVPNKRSQDRERDRETYDNSRASDRVQKSTNRDHSRSPILDPNAMRSSDRLPAKGKNKVSPHDYRSPDSESLRITVGNDHFIKSKGDARRDHSRERSWDRTPDQRDRSDPRFFRESSEDKYRDRQRSDHKMRPDDPIFADVPPSPDRSMDWERESVRSTSSFQSGADQSTGRPLKSILKKKVEEPPPTQETSRGAGGDTEFSLPGLGNDAPPQTSIFSAFGIGSSSTAGGIPGLGAFDVEDEDAFLYGDDNDTSPNKTATSRTDERRTSMDSGHYKGGSDHHFNENANSGYRDGSVSRSSVDRGMSRSSLDRGPSRGSFDADVRYREDSRSRDVDRMREVHHTERAGQSVHPGEQMMGRQEVRESRHSDEWNRNPVSHKETTKEEERAKSPEARSRELAKDPTIESILKSIGFNFELSKMMQEKAKKERVPDKLDPSQFGISLPDQASSFMNTQQPPMVKEDHPPQQQQKKKKYAEKLMKQESYEERARRYREEQARAASQPQRQAPTQQAQYHRKQPERDTIRDPFSDNDQTLSGLSMLQDSYEDNAPPSSFSRQPDSYHGHPMDSHYHDELGYGAGHMDFPPDSLHHQEYDMAAGMDYQPQPSANSGSSFIRVLPTIDLDFSSEKQNKPSASRVQASIRRQERGDSPVHSKRTVLVPKSEEPKSYPPSHDRSSSRDRLSKGDYHYTEHSRSVAIKEKKTDDSVGTDEKGRRDKERPSIKSSQKPVLSEKERLKLLKEREERQERLGSLEWELGKLKKQQNELMRKKQRQAYGHKDPLLVENSKLQAEIASQISSLRKAADDNFKMLKTAESSSKKESQVELSKKVKDPQEKVKESDIYREQKKKELERKTSRSPHKHEKPEKDKPNVQYDYFDNGNHWCSLCDFTGDNISDFFHHLNSPWHKKQMAPNDRPWMPKGLLQKTKPIRTQRSLAMPIKGVEFLMPASALYCTLCKEFFGDTICSADHVKSESHNENYQKYAEQNPFYEKRLNLDRAASLRVGDSLNKDLGKRKNDEEYEDIIEDKRQRTVKDEMNPPKAQHETKRGDSSTREATANKERSQEPPSKSDSTKHPLRFNLKFKSQENASANKSSTPASDWDGGKNSVKTGFGKFAFNKKESSEPQAEKPGKISIKLGGKTTDAKKSGRIFSQKQWPKPAPELPDASALRKTQNKLIVATAKKEIFLHKKGPSMAPDFLSGSKDLSSLPVFPETPEKQSLIKPQGPMLPESFQASTNNKQNVNDVPHVQSAVSEEDSSTRSNIGLTRSQVEKDEKSKRDQGDGDVDDGASDGSGISVNMDSDFEVLDECEDEA